MVLKFSSRHMGFKKDINYKNEDDLFVKLESFLVGFYSLIAKLN